LTRDEITTAARQWIGTPYHHQAALRGVGADCLGLVRGVWRDLYGEAAEAPPAYTRDWAEARGREELVNGAGRHLLRVEAEVRRPGDVLVFRLRQGVPAKHAGVLVTEETFVHAVEGAPACEVALGQWWRRRIAAVFKYPGVID